MSDKLYICGITSNEYDKINDLINKTKEYVDGYVWCVDSNPNSDSTYQLLEENKGEGKIVRHQWTNSHDFQMNEFLYSGGLQDGDWFYICDSSELPQKHWLEKVRENIREYEETGVTAVVCSGRPYLLKYTEQIFFIFTPHWTVHGLDGKMIYLPEEKKDHFIINKRNLTPDKHYQEHDTKYYLIYGRSNQIEMFYGKFGPSIVNKHEKSRKEFRQYLKKTLNEPLTLQSFEKWLRKDVAQFTEYEINMIELEFCLSEYYQRVILGMNFMGNRYMSNIPDGMHPRFQWSFRNYIKFGDGWIDKDYKGTILIYNKTYV